MDRKQRWWLYILELEDEKWYVGITSKTPDERFEEHRLGKRAAYWTMQHKPQKIQLIEDLGIVSKEHAEHYENKITRQLMKERGLNNVRGGDLRDTELYVNRFGWIWKHKDYVDMRMFFAGAIALFASAFYILWHQISEHGCPFFCG